MLTTPAHPARGVKGKAGKLHYLYGLLNSKAQLLVSAEGFAQAKGRDRKDIAKEAKWGGKGSGGGGAGGRHKRGQGDKTRHA